MSTSIAEKQSPAAAGSTSSIDRLFRISRRGSTLATEIRGGIVTFFAMAYILVLNPLILQGPDSTGHYLGGGTAPNIPAIAAGTALVAGVMSILMGSIANYPIALAAGLGLNSMVASTIVQIPGMTWADGMGIIVIEGFVILLLVLTGLREAIFRAVPRFLRAAISVSLGLFITLIGLLNAGLVHTFPGGLSFGINGSVGSWPLVVFVFGVVVIIVGLIRKVKGAVLWGILASTVFALIAEAIGHFGVRGDKNPMGWALTVPALNGSPVNLPDFSTLGQFSVVGPFQKVGVVAVAVLAFSILLSDFFDTLGTMIAVGTEGGLLDKEGNPPSARQILIVDSMGAMAGGLGGVSSNTVFVESTTGVAEGARTGIAPIVTGTLFLLATFLSPLFAMVPNEAAAPALVTVGFLMMQQVVDIDWKALHIAIPSFMTIAMAPFAFSISVGIGAGFLTYILVEVARGKARTIHPLMWGSGVVFVVYFLLDPIQKLLGVA
ncbi:AGZA family xanthine/uracil permease-like MFS transporter [Arcanobacterium wilhelmae]|uniref:AGZA family xanthine/uracil permease-like MFS transporter n=1 Tax=Arcanobacterium wilhelmae TaxID=1803177 RepID=A0ABT9NCQ8_9ACTO|nr:NCS2 family permease [Arcanobacterium wilhelmae]MDP9801166.1 AGZA family xanthine/uracil permease-like MFS transporter [Arcanobacterium wilhelmae]